MTTILMDWNEMTLEASGHAGQAEAGKDIVCAGISALTLALANMVLEEEAKGKIKAEAKADNGRLRVHVKAKGKALERVRAYYRLVVGGLKDIKSEWPDNIMIMEVGQDGID